jgi:hypothetical protein
MAHLEKQIRNYVHNVDNSFTKEVISTTIEYYPGTQVTYTPASGSEKVIYECDIQMSWDPHPLGSYPCTRLQYSTDNGSSWNTISGTQMLEGNYDSKSDYNWHNMLYTFILDSWTGERKIRLAGRAHGSTTTYSVGQSYGTLDSGEGVGSCPHVSIYSVMS